MDEGVDLSKGKHKHRYKDLYSVPRRFDLASMLVVTTAFALLFTCMTLLDFNVWAFVYFASLVSFVGIAQSIFDRYDPRHVSMMAGVGFHLLLTIGLVITPYFLGAPSRYGRYSALRAMSCVSASGIALGPIWGYLSGAVVAGAFLVSDYLRSFLAILHLSRRHSDDSEERNSPWDE